MKVPLIQTTGDPDPWRHASGHTMVDKPHRGADHILLCATELFARKGFEHTSIAEVSRSAGTNCRTIYRYYRSKERLFRAVIRRACRHFGHCLTAALNSECDFRTKCWLLVHRFLLDAEENPNLWRLMLSSIWSPALIANRDLARLRAAFLRQLRAEAMKAVVRGEIRAIPEATAVHAIFGTVAFAVGDSISAGHSAIASAQADDVIATLFQGLDCKGAS